MKKTWKRALAMVCTAAMVMTGVSWPGMKAEAANEESSLKDVYEEAVISNAISGCGWAEGTTGAVYDKNTGTHWHSYFGNGGEGPVIADSTTAADNSWIYVTLQKAEDVAGIEYVKRAAKNGTFKTFKVMVSTTENGDDWKDVEIASVNGEKVTTQAYGNDTAGHYVTLTYNDYNAVEGKKLIFKDIQTNIKRVKFVVKESYGNSESQNNKFLSAAELRVLTLVSQIDDSVLASRAVANSYKSLDSTASDGPASNVFNDEAKIWHQNYGGGAGSQNEPSAGNEIYMATGFGDNLYLTGFYIEARDGRGHIYDYDVSVINEDASLEFDNPAIEEREDSKVSVTDYTWKSVHTVTGDQSTAQRYIYVKFEQPQLASHVKVTFRGVKNDYVMIRRMKFFGTTPEIMLSTLITSVDAIGSDLTEEELAVLNAAKKYTFSEATLNALDEHVTELRKILDVHTDLTLDKETLNLRYHANYVSKAGLKTTVHNGYRFNDVTWSSSDENVITVNEDGIVTATGAGTATVTASLKNLPNVTAKCTVNVTELDFTELENIALHKTVETNATLNMGNITQVTDGDLSNYIDLNVAKTGKYVQIDLGEIYKVDALCLYRYYADDRSYKNTVVALAAEEKDFTTGKATILWNADNTGAHGLGVGYDGMYAETANGFGFASAETVKARYARLYMQGSTVNNYDHLIEIQVFGKENSHASASFVSDCENMGTVTATPTTFLEGNTVAVTFTAEPSEKWYDFVGWYDNAEGSGKPVSTEASFTKELSESTTYYAKFVADKETDSFGTYIYASDDLEMYSSSTGYGCIGINERYKESEDSKKTALTLYRDGKSEEYEKGIGTHARSEIVYDISGKGFKYFTSNVGIDGARKEAANHATVGFEVYTSTDKNTWTKAAVSPEMHAYDCTHVGTAVTVDGNVMNVTNGTYYITANVEGANYVKLVATTGSDNVNYGDHANWADAKFYFGYEPQTGTIESSSIELTGKIGVNFQVQVSEEKAENAKVRVTLNGREKEQTTYNVKDLSTVKIGEETYYVVTQKVAAAQMTDIVTAELLIDGKTVSARSQSVKAYAEKLLKADSGTYSENLISLVKSMLNYGAYAQVKFNWHADALANAGLQEADSSLGELLTVNAPEKITDIMIGENKVLSGVSLVLESGTSLRYYLNGEADTEGCSYAINGKAVEPIGSDAGQYLEYTEIPAALLDNSYELIITKGENTFKAQYSPLNYIKDTLDSETAEEVDKNIVKALYFYNEAANNYFNK